MQLGVVLYKAAVPPVQVALRFKTMALELKEYKRTGMASIEFNNWRTRGHKGLKRRNVPMKKGDYGQKKNDEESSTSIYIWES
ncbi:hypothetical protein TWF481_001058 [Arthrobotrys musiformis]|uniref:Uncharacterized protein n=1 Tax=Arthrobotrys musiformis TaxID=47236 RepID=A0AAV9WPF6_9PEZI